MKPSRSTSPTRWTVALLLFSLLVSLVPSKARAEAEDTKAAGEQDSEFLRVVRDDQNRVTKLETSIMSFKSEDPDTPITVDLVGAVHVGDKAYYDQLNREFENYDVVLYELVAKPGTKIPKGGGSRNSSHPIAMLQNGMKSVLELEHQLERVDYTKDNFVHADMSPKQFSKSMEEKGESFFTLYLRLMSANMTSQSQQASEEAGVALLVAIFSSNRAVALKRVLAGQFEEMESAMAAIEGPNGSTLITERNKAALAVLKKQIEDGKRHIAIFYGAGHLVDMKERLEKEFHLTAQGSRWLTAWDMSSPKKKK